MVQSGSANKETFCFLVPGIDGSGILVTQAKVYLQTTVLAIYFLKFKTIINIQAL